MVFTGFVTGVPTVSVPSRFDPEAKNNTDVELTVQMVKDNDPNCTEINFNNIPVSRRTACNES